MTLDLDDCVLAGPAITWPFLHDGLSQVVNIDLRLPAEWNSLRRSLRCGGTQRVHQHVTSNLAKAFGYQRPQRQDPVITREGSEDGGWLLRANNGLHLRTWSVASESDLDGPPRSIRAGRSSPARMAQRVLLARGELAGLLTNGETLRLLLSDPLRADSHISVAISGWPQTALPPDSFHLLRALAGADGLPRLPAILQAARLHQTRVTVELRRQAREAIVGFINFLPDRTGLDAAALWHEGLIIVYRLLFILKLESPSATTDGFSFASTRLWRQALSPNQALGPLVRRHLDHAHDTGRMLQNGLRSLFAIFRDGLRCSELHIAPLGGALFGPDTTPVLDRLDWSERAVAILLDRLIWIVSAKGERRRVHYGSLDVEDLGSIYEGLLEQEPAIATQAMLRVRRGKLEAFAPAAGDRGDIMPGQFFLRAGIGRKASGSFYTKHEFVRFLVRETLDSKIAALSPPDDPNPARLLTLRIVDPATGSGHFLVEACRHLGEALLTACRLCDEQGRHDRLAALPDPDQTIVAYLPSRGFAETRARAICRRMVAVHCLYGCDRNKLAVELAKLSLWLESYAEGLPLTFLDHRLAHGDALTGPFFASLSTLPVTGGPLDPLLAQGVAARLDATLALARRMVVALDASIGRDIDDLAAKQQIKQRLDQLLRPLRQLAQCWAGAAMLRQRDSDDVWLALAAQVAASGDWPDQLTVAQTALMVAGADALPWDLVFPEVFPQGFSVVLGNPPWNIVLPSTRDFVAAFDPAELAARPGQDRATIEKAVLARPEAAAAFDLYRASFDQLKRIAGRLYRHQRVRAGEATTAGNLDLFRLFAERYIDLLAPEGAVGVLLPSAFHANEGATGIRRLYLEQTNISWCLSFENRRRIFDIDSRFKFDLIVAQRPGPTVSMRCGFYLDRIEDAADPAKIMTYDIGFLRQTGGANLTPLELRSHADLQIAHTLYTGADRLEAWCARQQIRFGCDLHMTADAACFRPAGEAALVLHEGKTFHQYADRWGAGPRYSVDRGSLPPAIANATRHYRLAFRDIARSNDARTMIACIVPPDAVFGHTATVEKAPEGRAMAEVLMLCAVFNSFAFDWLVRQKTGTHLSLYLLNALPVPRLSAAARRFLAQAALRLSCTHSGYAALWNAEADRAAERPVCRDNDAEWSLRAQVDAMVAQAYGLDRRQYQQILSGFNHRVFPAAPTLCLAAFDTLTKEACV